MRQHKFRVWDKTLNKFQYLDLREAIACDDAYSLCMGQDEKCYLGCKCDIMQCIGLVDKNGKDIYEGDIIRDGEGLYTVKFEIDQELSHARGSMCGWLVESENEEVVGNIFENPD